MQADEADQLAFGDRALSAVINAMPLIRFDSTENSHLYAATLHASIVQLCGGCLAIARTEYTAGIPILMRSIFEALIDLDNLVRDSSYHERMEAANLEQFLDLLKQCPTNPLLAGLEKKHDIPKLVERFRDELNDLHIRKRGAKDLRSRCIDVDRETEYLTVYKLLCMDTHNNVVALIGRHVSQNHSESLKVDAFGDDNPSELDRRIFVAIGWMLQSAEFVHGAFGTGHNVADLQREHEAFRSVHVSRS